jgi:hypothetical protein
MNRETDSDEMLPEYDFSKGVRGRYAGRFFPAGPWSVGEQVVLDQDVPAEHLQKGDVGEVVHRYEGGGAFRVRFGPPAGDGSVVLALAAPQLRSLDPQEVLQARKRG